VFLPRWPDGLKIHAAYNRIIHRCAQQREEVHLVPIHATFLGHGSHCTQFWRAHYRPDDPHYWYFNNIEDPNDRGYDALRRVFLLEIARVLRVRPTTTRQQTNRQQPPQAPVPLARVALAERAATNSVTSDESNGANGGVRFGFLLLHTA
jgi:hypothetical protein